MFIASWNVRGLNQASKQNTIVNFVRVNKVRIFCLLETKMSTTTFENFINVRFNSWMSITNFDKINGGRMAIIWDPCFVDGTVLQVHKQHVHARFRCNTTQITFYATFVYALYTVVQRRELWEHISLLGTNILGPWVILGDFNCVGSPSERSGSAPPPPSGYAMKDLNDMKIQTNLDDAPSTGELFTWHRGAIWAKLDRVLVNSFWSTQNVTCRAHFFDMECEFDHVASLVTIGAENREGTKPFKFFNMWLKHEQFDGILKSVWGRNVAGTAQFRLARKLKLLKQPLKQLNKNEFSHITARAKEAKKEYKRIYQLALLSPQDDVLKNELSGAKRRALFFKEAEEAYLKQKAKVVHLIQADRGTRYFHSIVKKKQTQNTIASIKLEDGSLTNSLDQVATEFVSFFKGLFGTSVASQNFDPEVMASGKTIDTMLAANLISPITDLEIRQALFDIGSDKAPGPDGYSSAFFKANWNIVGEGVCEAVKEFFLSGTLLRQVNHTVVALIPKTKHSPTVSDFRPISCTNVTYKIITKILASRLGPCLSGIINPAQGAFVDGRLMSDNIFLAQELVRGYARKRVTPRCMIKIDLRKAYDTVSWDFLDRVLRHIGLPDLFVKWIMECVTTSSFSISINGVLHGWFEGKRGLRQGDPMSPMLFVICLEYFSRMLDIRTSVPTFCHHPLCSKQKISHLAYADDLMLFSKGNYASIKILVEALNDYGLVSGLTVNHDKSNIFLGGNVANQLAYILQMVDFQQGSFPVKYLGIPLAPLKISVAQFAPLLDTVTDYINAWNTKTLSYAGRVELIRSVMQGVQSFWLGIFPAPKAILDRITGICRIFLWGGKHTKVAWDDVCLPIDEGGLGLKNTKVWNNALLSRTLWNIHSKKDSLWVKWVNGVYLHGRDVWTFVPHNRDSLLMKRFALIRDLIVSKFSSINEALVYLGKITIDGRLSSSKVYDLLRIKGTPHPWMSFIWKSYIPPKFSFIAWLAFRNRLATYDNLEYLDVINVCPFCKGEPETVSHLYFECIITGQVWTRIKAWLGITRQMTTLRSAVKWIKKEHNGAHIKAKAVRITFCFTIYWMWRTRNSICFEAAKVKVEDIIHHIKYMVYKVLFSIYPYHMITF
ncbi:unnamed protein product [Cuscuta epithymum]|uniref:Reverse transcriptase domain-containing protein n=1 Tax=Cuscuta epithymum TaxID=186058 RepID=A0AAV0D3I2_9ASTE|nr:unnamed protein product [Cuscuta epithymum]